MNKIEYLKQNRIFKTNNLLSQLLALLVLVSFTYACGDPEKTDKGDDKDVNTETETKITGYELEFVSYKIAAGTTETADTVILPPQGTPQQVAQNANVTFVFNVHKKEQDFYKKDGKENKKSHKAGDAKPETEKKTKLAETDVDGKFTCTLQAGVSTPEITIDGTPNWDNGVGGFQVKLKNTNTTTAAIDPAYVVINAKHKTNGKSCSSKKYVFKANNA